MKWAVIEHAEMGGTVCCAVVDADDEQAAAADGMWTIWQNEASGSDALSAPTSCVVVPIPEGAIQWRAVVGAEPVPDEFQCCGGMPDLETLGTTDEHTAICARRVTADA